MNVPVIGGCLQFKLSNIDTNNFNGFPKEVSHPQGMCRA
jgi:hypothetical protein